MGTDVEKGKRDEASDFTDLVGGNGPWQRTIFIMFVLAGIPSAWHNLSMSFLAPNVNHWCAKPDQYSNLSTAHWKSLAIPRESFTSADDYNQCHQFKFLNSSLDDLTTDNTTTLFKNGTRSDLMECQKWDYDDSVYLNTVVNQWNLVCQNAWMVSMTKSVFMAGFLTSVLVLGHLSDKIGRKPVMVASVIVLVVSGILCAFSISFIMFTVTRFFIAFGASGIFNTAFVMLMEVVSAETRSVYGIAVEFGWCIGYVMLAGLAWLVRDWFWLQLLLTVPCIGLMAIWWMIPESPRWLMTKGNMDKAVKILSRAADKNKKNVQDLEGALKKMSCKNLKEQTEMQRGSLVDLISTPGLWQKTLNIYFCWFVNSFIYYGLSFNTNDLAGDPFVNFAISGAVEFPAYLISIFVIKSLGRRIPLMATMVAGGLACLFTVPLNDDLAWIQMPLAMFGKFCITASFAIIYVYTAEIFPTVLRNTGVGTSSMCARIGSILAPFVKELGIATHPAVPLACYGLLSVLSGLLIMLLPETNHCKVPDTLEEAANFGRKKKKPRSESVPEIPKVCAIHDGNGEKPKPPSPISKPNSDGKKLPDLLEEPSIVDEGMDDNELNDPETPPTQDSTIQEDVTSEETSVETPILVPDVVIAETPTESLEMTEKTIETPTANGVVNAISNTEESAVPAQQTPL